MEDEIIADYLQNIIFPMHYECVIPPPPRTKSCFRCRASASRVSGGGGVTPESHYKESKSNWQRASALGGVLEVRGVCVGGGEPLAATTTQCRWGTILITCNAPRKREQLPFMITQILFEKGRLL